MMYCFFFQAEDGIRDGHVTGVQTCALPIWRHGGNGPWRGRIERREFHHVDDERRLTEETALCRIDVCQHPYDDRSEEHTSELQSRGHLVCRLLLEKKKKKTQHLK